MLKMIVSFIVLGLLGVVYLNYKKNSDKKQLAINIIYLGTIVGLGVVGRIMHSISPLYIAQYIALAIASLGFLYFLFTKRFIWWSLVAPIAVLALYLILAFTTGEAKLN
jgi:hypothetical protein